MPLVVLGTNHKTADLELREKWSYNFNNSSEVTLHLKELSEKLATDNLALLSTCNRTEIYCYLDNPNDLKQWFNQSIKPITKLDIEQHGYLYQDIDAVSHMMRVASGLDSMVIGEPEILGQFKQAYNFAKRAKTNGKRIEGLFQQVLKAAKVVRHSTDIGLHPLSVASISVDLLMKELDKSNNPLADINILLIGSGDVIKTVSKNIFSKNSKHNKNINKFDIASRNSEKAKKLIRTLDLNSELNKTGSSDCYSLDLLENNNTNIEQLAQYDVIFSATSSETTIIKYDLIEKIVAHRKNNNLNQLLLMDLALPRDIDFKCNQLAEVSLYNIDDLKLILSNNSAERKKAAHYADVIIHKFSQEFISWEESLYSLSSLCAYREQAEVICQDVIDKAKRKLSAGQDPEEVLISALQLLRNKLLHHPTMTLKSLAQNNNLPKIDLLKDLLNL